MGGAMTNFRLLSRARQSTEYTCGPSALQAVFRYWGKDVAEDEIAKLAGTTSEVGTFPEDLVRSAKALGFKAEAKEGLTLDEVQEFTAAGHPMIALAQVWLSAKGLGGKSVEEEWDSGHYIVVLGVDKDYVYFQDPYAMMSKAFLPRKAFEAHWHQAMGGDVINQPKLRHVGIFVRGRKPAKRERTAEAAVSRLDLGNMGSLNLVVLEFPGALMPYDFLNELRDIWDSGHVRPNAFILLRKDSNRAPSPAWKAVVSWGRAISPRPTPYSPRLPATVPIVRGQCGRGWKARSKRRRGETSASRWPTSRRSARSSDAIDLRSLSSSKTPGRGD